ncbi:MAG: FCD domain-containing protein [Azospirillum sp.]|nr:FCD domain-containing protein [Azospirillum sp.]
MTYRKVTQERLSDAISKQLEGLILEGVLRPGERLPPERELARELDVSRPSLREALQKLEASGLLETRHGGGTYIKNAFATALTEPLIDLFQRHPETAYDFIEFRYTLEGIGAYYAALRATEDDRTLLRQRFDAMEAAHALDDATEEAERDADFHLAIAEASHNLVLMHVMRGLFALLRKGVVFNRMKLYGRPDARNLLLEQHRAMITHILAGDADAARAAAHAHMNHVLQVLREMQLDEARINVARRRLARQRDTDGDAAPRTPGGAVTPMPR